MSYLFIALSLVYLTALIGLTVFVLFAPIRRRR